MSFLLYTLRLFLFNRSIIVKIFQRRCDGIFNGAYVFISERVFVAQTAKEKGCFLLHICRNFRFDFYDGVC